MTTENTPSDSKHPTSTANMSSITTESGMVNDENREHRLKAFLNDFEYSPEYMQELAQKVQNEIDRSYEAHAVDPTAAYDPAKSDFRSLDTCVHNVPSGQERGIYYGIDVGGTNLRVVRCDVSGGGKSSIDADKYNIASHELREPLPKGLLDKRCGASLLFDYIADAVKKMLIKHDDDNQYISIGFTFSFGIQMEKINRATVVAVSKGFETGCETDDPLVGQDCVAMMNAALRRKQVKAVISGCLNDTTGTLLTAAYEAGEHRDLPPVKIGMILGTGFNTAVADDKALDHSYHGSLINLESGGLVCRDHSVDEELDKESTNKRQQNAEKKISGAYLAEVARLSYIFVLQSEAPTKMKEIGSIHTPDIADIFNSYEDQKSCLNITRDTCKKLFGWDASDAHCQLIADITNAVWYRSAAIVATVIAGCAEQTGLLQHSMGGLTVGVDGSMYSLNPLYQTLIRKNLETILGPRHKLCHIIETADGSGKGAAMLACANPVHFSKF